jgi:hypothetical protein
MKPRRAQLTWPVVPIEALRLNEDLRALERCCQIMDSVDPSSVADELKDGRKILRKIYLDVRMCQRHAENKMRTEYLNPARTKIERRHRKPV